MEYVFKAYPEFAWSISRQRLFDQCSYAYYCSYYLAHNGWLDEASDEARLAYRLKQLTSLDRLLGLEIDKRAAELEAAARAGLPLPSVDELEQRTRAALRSVWRRARDGRGEFERRPRRVTMLRSFYLGDDTQSEVERLNARLRPALEGLLATVHWQRLRECGERGGLAIPAYAWFTFAGEKIYAAPDLAYVHDGAVHVIDWKSGRSTPSDADQVQIQGLFLRAAYPQTAALEFAGHLEYVAGDGEVPVTLDGEAEARAAETIRVGIAALRALRAAGGENVPLPREAFGRRESTLCASCSFAPLCR